jgi:predicted phosphodiesterase
MIETIRPLPGPMLLFGGPYSNLDATEAIRQIAENRGIGARNCICTGDVVAYCAHPEETVGLIRQWGVPVVMGNCEDSLGHQADDCACGFELGSACSDLSIQWYRYANREVSPQSRAWMRALPSQIRFAMGGRTFVVVHGSVSRINRFIFPSTPRVEKQAELDRTDADVVIGGHAGIPFGQRVEHRVWLNTGAIGLPANDGTPDGWYLLLTPNADGVIASWHRLGYDAASASAAMRERGLANAYAETLLTGLWPSQDVLPGVERAQRGEPLKPQPLRL